MNAFRGTITRAIRSRMISSMKTPRAYSVIPPRVSEAVSREIAGSKPAAAAGASTTATIVSTAVFGTLLCAGGYGAYSLVSPVENEPEAVTNAANIFTQSWQRAAYRVMSAYKYLVDPWTDSLLPDPYEPGHPLYRPYTLLIEMDKFLVYSSWDNNHGWKVAKRPWTDYFLAYLSQYYEIVIFTSQTPMYAAPILDKLDSSVGAITYRLYKESTRYDVRTGDLVKDLSILNRDPGRVLLMDPDPRHYKNTQPENAIEVEAWTGQPNDTYLRDIIPFLETIAISGSQDVRPILQSYRGLDIPTVFAENMARVQRMQREEYEKKVGAGVTGAESWTSYIGKALSSLLFGGATSRNAVIPPNEEDYAKMREMQHVQFVENLESHRKAQDEFVKTAEKEHENIMQKAKNIKVTLWEMMTVGPEQAIKNKADPEVREFLERMQAQQPAAA